MDNFSLFFLEHPIIKLYTKKITVKFPLKLSDFKSDFTLNLGYLNPALNNLVWQAKRSGFESNTGHGVVFLGKVIYSVSNFMHSEGPRSKHGYL